MLWPLSLLYGSIAGARRMYFELFNKRSSTEIPTLIVGNLTVGGTGKTPMVLFLSNLLKSDYQLAVLSRGYGRNSKGFLEVETKSLAENVGDEPKEIKLQMPDIPVFVCENRLEGIEQIHDLNENINLVLLDDGFQHLPLRGKVNVLLCNFHRPFYDDFVMPAGRLREFKSAAKGVDILVVTKCPLELKESESEEMQQILQHYSEQIFFASYRMSEPQLVFGEGGLLKGDKVILVTGIADGKVVKDGLADFDVVQHFEYGDHVIFNQNQLDEWIQFARDCEIKNVVMTRKDWMRVRDIWDNMPEFDGINLYEVHTEVSFLFGGTEKFRNTIKELL